MKPKTLLKLLASLCLMVFFLSSTGAVKTFERLATANLWVLPLGVGVYLFSQWISAYRWQFLAHRLGFTLSLREFYDYYLMGMFMSLFMPGSIGGDVGRMWYLAKNTQRKKREALLTLLAERGVGLVALLWLTAGVCLLPQAHPIPKWVQLPVLCLAGGTLLGYLLLNLVPLNRLESMGIRKLEPVLDWLKSASVYWQDTSLLAKSIGISLAVQGMMVLLQWLIAQALGIQVTIVYLTAVYGLVSLVSVIPLFFNGIGVREGAYQYLLVKAGVLPETALAFGLYWFLVSTCTSLFGWLVFLKGHYKTPSQQELTEQLA